MPNHSDPNKYVAHFRITATRNGEPSRVVSSLPPITPPMDIADYAKQQLKVNPPPIVAGGSGNGGSPQ